MGRSVCLQQIHFDGQRSGLRLSSSASGLSCRALWFKTRPQCAEASMSKEINDKKRHKRQRRNRSNSLNLEPENAYDYFFRSLFWWWRTTGERVSRIHEL